MALNTKNKICLFFYTIFLVIIILNITNAHILRYNYTDPLPLFPSHPYDLLMNHTRGYLQDMFIAKICTNKNNVFDEQKDELDESLDEDCPREILSISIMPFMQNAKTGTNFNGLDKLSYYDYSMQQSLLTPTSNSAQVNTYGYYGESQNTTAIPLANTVPMPLSAIPEPISFLPLFFPWDPKDAIEPWIYDPLSGGDVTQPNIPTGNTYGNLAAKIIARRLGYNHLAEIDDANNADTAVDYVPLFFDYSNYTNDFFTVLQNPISRDPAKLFGYGYFNIEYKKYGIRGVVEMRPLKNIGFKIYTGVANLEMNIQDTIDTTSLSQGPVIAHMFTRYPDTFNTNGSASSQYAILNIAQLSPYSRALIDNNNNNAATSNPDLGGPNSPNPLFADQFKSLLIQNVQNNMQNLGSLLKQDFNSYSKQGIEDSTFEIYARHLIIKNVEKSNRKYPLYGIIPMLSCHITAPCSSRVESHKKFARSLGNNGHWEYGLDGGFTVDFFKTLSIGMSGGLAFFSEGSYCNVPIQTKNFEEGLYTYTGNIIKTPGNMYTVGFALESRAFTQSLNFTGEYRYVHHAKDSITLLNINNPFEINVMESSHIASDNGSTTPTTINLVQQGVMYLNVNQDAPIPGTMNAHISHMEDISVWSSHLFNISFDIAINNDFILGLSWQQPFSLFNCYNSSTLGITLKAIW